MIAKLESLLNCDITEIFPPEYIDAIQRKLGKPLTKIYYFKELPPFVKAEYLLQSHEKEFEEKEFEDELDLAVNLLTEREKKVIAMRFGLNGNNEHTLEETARELKVSRERVRQIEQYALRKLRYRIEIKRED